MLVGPSVMDLNAHYVERWNFVRHLKYRHDPRYPILAFPHVYGDGLDPIVYHPHYEAFKKLGKSVSPRVLAQTYLIELCYMLIKVSDAP